MSDAQLVAEAIDNLRIGMGVGLSIMLAMIGWQLWSIHAALASIARSLNTAIDSNWHADTMSERMTIRREI